MRHSKTIMPLSVATTLLLAGGCDVAVAPHDREVEQFALEDDEPMQEADEQEIDDILLEDGEESFGEGVTLLDRIELAGGTVLTFVHLDIEGDESIGVIEKQPAGAIGLADLGLPDASFLDLYLALTEPEIDVPIALLQLAEDNELGERGWLGQQIEHGDLELTAPPNVAAAACDAGFQSYLTNWWASVDDGSEWGFNEDPDSDSDWYGPTEPLGLGIACTNCSESWWHRDYYNDQFEIFNVDEMKMAISACAIGWRPTISTNGGGSLTHYGPTLRFRYRTENNASTGQVYSNDLSEAEEGGRWRWHWKGSATSGDNDFDWTIEVANGRATDRFDIGFVWNHYGW